MALRRWNVGGPGSSRSGVVETKRNVGNIPDFDATAYGGEELDRLDLAGLARAYDTTQTVLTLVEVRHRQTRTEVETCRVVPLPPNLKERFTDSCDELNATRNVATTVRRIFAKRLREQFGPLGFLLGSAVYRAEVDCKGIERIELANPPLPPKPE